MAFLKNSLHLYLREIKNAPAGLLLRRKSGTWLMQCRFYQITLDRKAKIVSNISAPNTAKVSEEVRNLESGVSEDGNEFISEEIESQSGLDNIEGQYVTPTAFSSKETKKNKTNKSSAAEVVAGPMAEYLKTVTAQVKSQRKNQELEDPTLTFFKSLVPDVNKLNSRK